MTAQEILYHLKQIFLQTTENGEYHINHPETALYQLFRVFAPFRVNELTINQLAEKANFIPLAVRQQLTERLAQFLPDFIASSFYHESDLYPQLSPAEITSNTFVGYWAALSALNLGNNVLPTDLDLVDKFVALVKKSQPYRLNLRHQNLQNANLSYLKLSQADFSFANLQNALIMNAQLPQANFYNTDMDKAKLMNTDLQGAFFSFANLTSANLSESNLAEATLHGANLTQADLSQVNLNKANLDYAQFDSADLTLANLAYCEGVQTDFSQANLSKANFQNTKLRQVSFKKTNLYATDFRQSDTDDCDWEISNAQKADFRGARLNQQGQNLVKRLGAIVE
ncbi:MAG: pentapeptide repeat-containing protein [Microscillaceae bacterium]|jgi:uncharacterized protein YjbI with pentapeptide repeats|nr:pentapeptide repeat-containing protein [Microscillaceae bacterium]